MVALNLDYLKQGKGKGASNAQCARTLRGDTRNGILREGEHTAEERSETSKDAGLYRTETPLDKKEKRQRNGRCVRCTIGGAKKTFVTAVKGKRLSHGNINVPRRLEIKKKTTRKRESPRGKEWDGFAKKKRGDKKQEMQGSADRCD